MKPRLRMGTTLPALVLAIAAALPAQAGSFTAADAEGRATYLITFSEPGLLATHQQNRVAGAAFDFNDPSLARARTELQTAQAAHLSSIKSLLGRGVEASHHYLVTHSGVALRLTDTEAAKLRGLPGVSNIQREREYQLDTYRGPEFIGAGGIWNGDAVPGGVGVDGRGMVAAILDTGIQSSHPSFANDASCGFTAAQPKVLSSLDCGATDASGVCNGSSPEDTNGHGSHTASTVAGNRLDASASPAPSYTEISGVAPCASVRSYKVCPGSSCPGAAITAGMNSVLIHGDVDSVNFSISGGANPWSDNDRTFLDMVDAGIFVAASAGNNSQADPTVVGRVNHRGPWVMSVAASTHDGGVTGEVIVDGQTYEALHGSASPAGGSVAGMPIRFDPAQPTGADGCAGFPANFFDGAIALIQRGTCNFTDKVNNAADAGAEMVLIWNNAAGAIIPSTPGQDPNTPVYGIQQAAGQAIRNYISANPGTAEADFNVIPGAGDVLADFSYRGPTPSPLQHLQKPDITAPGVDIYAAVPGGYGSMSGTSMSGPHVAGAGLLVAQVQPSWTPSEIKSALQMTAHKAGTKENGSTSWDWDDVGHGRAMVNRAVNAGLVLDETTANYLAANPASSGDVRTLNLAGLRNLDCSPSCTWTRTVRNTLGSAATWTATGAGITANMNITVSPSTFSFSGNTSETQELTITATPVDNLVSTIGFGEIVFEEDGGLSPDLHFTVAIRGEPAVLDVPVIELDQSQLAFVMNPDVTSSQSLTISNTGTQPLTWNITEAVPAALRGAYNPAMDEVLSIPNFTVNPAAPVNFSVPGGVTNNGNVIGFTFQGTVTALNGWDYASDMRMLMTSPDSQSFDVGGFFTVVNPWDFDGEDVVGTYTSTHLGAFNDAPSVGNWNFSFTHGYSGGANMPWQDVTITLHKSGTPSVCTDPSDITWLSVTPDNGTTAPAGNTSVSIDVDTTGLAVGDYSAIVCVASNDPARGLLEVPVSLTVMTGTIAPAAIDVSETAYNFALVGGPAGEADSADLIISNTGNMPLSWVIDTAAGTTGQYQVVADTGTRPSGPQPVLGTLDGSVQVFANQLAGIVGPRGTADATMSVDGMYSSAGSTVGSPANSSRVLNIGVGNEMTGIGWEVTITANSPSWLDDAGVLFVPSFGDTSGLFLRPGGGVETSGTQTFSSGGVLMLADAEIPNVPANAAGELYVQMWEAFVDGANPDSEWADSASPTTLPPGLRLICTDQAACDAAVSGAPMPASCDAPSNISWLNVDPASGLTAGGNSSTVAVSVDASGLAAGTYEALLCVASNDATNPLIEIPVVLDVTAPATISVDPTSISATIDAGSSDAANLTISNVGGAVLNWQVDETGSSASVVLRATDVVTIPSSVGGSAASGLSGFAGQMSGIGEFVISGTGTTITHSSSMNVASGTVACSPDSGTTTSGNQYLRTFTLADFGIDSAFQVSEVEFGIENLSAAHPITVNLYTLDGAFTYANMTLIGTVTQTLTAQQLSLVSVPVTGSVPAGGTLVVEIAPPDLSGVAAFFPGSNSLGQTAPSYLASAGCGIADPSTYASIGYPNVHLVMSVSGTAGAPACELPDWIAVNPTAGSIAAGDDEAVTVSLDATNLTPGQYEASICIASNDPANPLVVVPVTLEVPLGADGAIVEGTVESQGYCSADASALAGAAVQITGANDVYNVVTDANGHYQVIMHIDESPVTVAVTAADHIGASETGVALVAEGNVTVDFSLELNAACASADPGSLVMTLAAGAVGSQPLDLTNAGAASYTWTIDTEEVVSSAFPMGSVDVVEDGGFETTETTGAWDDDSAAFGTVLCTIDDCGTGSGTGPHGGNWWVWFGGVASGDTGYVAQDVTLPAGSGAELRFFLEIPVGGQPGSMTVSLGGDTLFSVTQADAATYESYQEVVIDVSAYADGGTYELRFDSVTSSSTGTTNFFVDDVSLVVQPGPLDCASPQALGWLVSDPATGAVAAHSTETVDVLYDAGGLVHGQYQANLCVETSDTRNDLIVIPVTLNVVEDDIFEDGFEGEDAPRARGTDAARRIRN